MAIHDLASQRLFIDAPLRSGAVITVGDNQAHYLIHVLRQKPGSTLLVFNGRDGEWAATIVASTKRSADVAVDRQVRPQVDGPDILYAFAPLKRARLDYMVQKATEMGVARIQPVLTQNTVAERVNLERMRANAVEAAEQCGVLRVPDVGAPARFEAFVDGWDSARPLIFCDEENDCANPIDALTRIPLGPLGVLIGPEGGFAPRERDALIAKPFVRRLSLGPRIMRADTAAVAALALVNATLGDWR
ncbi:MAG: 16S rRNA (uracil(1498)-N(3))-methyltransferase [Hyphomicrobium sp.]